MHRDNQDEITDLRNSIASMQRLLLRREDSVSMIQADYSFVAFLRVPGGSSVVPALYAAQRAWRDLRDSDSTKLDKPMRCCLLACLFKELAARVRGLTNEHENKSSLAKLGWLTEDHSSWAFLQWSPVEKRMVVAKDKEPVAVDSATALVEKIREMVSEPGLVVRFHPTRPLAETMTGESLTCCLQVSVREPRAMLLYDDLSTLSGLACAQLIGVGLRRDRAGRSALAQAISKTMR